MDLQRKKKGREPNHTENIIRKHCTCKECQGLAVLGKKLLTLTSRLHLMYAVAHA